MRQKGKRTMVSPYRPERYPGPAMSFSRFPGKRGRRSRTSGFRPGFTLIELLVVVAIIGIVMTMAVPSVYRQLHPDSIQQAVDDVMEACRQARAQAILRRRPMEVRIRPYDRSITIGPAQAGGGGSPDQPPRQERLNLKGEDFGLPERSDGGSAEQSNFSARISDRIAIEGIRLYVDQDFTEEELVPVRFYPNGMSDEFSIVLRSDQGEWRMINLDVITGLPSFKTDPATFMDYR